jgi:hypothetical protein
MRLITILSRGFLAAGLAVRLGPNLPAEDDVRRSDDSPLRLPPVGSCQLRVLAPNLLELTLVTTKPPDPAPGAQWNFVDARGQARLPEAGEFAVSADGHPIQTKRIGFKRRVLDATFRQRDLRIGNYLYLELLEPVDDNLMVVLRNPARDLWPTTARKERTDVALSSAPNPAHFRPEFFGMRRGRGHKPSGRPPTRGL